MSTWGTCRRRTLAAATGAEGEPWTTPEGIDVAPLYTAADLEGLDFLGTYPGIAPFLRGPYPTMYVNQPWTIRQYAGFSTAEESNAFYRRNLADGPEGPVGRVRPADPPRLRQRPPAGRRRRRHGRRRHRLDLRHAPALRRHPARPDERLDDDERRGAAGAGALRRRGRGAGRRARAAHRHDPERHPQRVHGPQHLHLPADAVDADHLRHLRLHRRTRMPKFNSISISGYHIQEAGATADLELAYTLADGVEYLRAGLAAGLDIDAFAPRLSFFWAIGMNFFMEVAKMRAGPAAVGQAGRRSSTPKNDKSLSLRTHSPDLGLVAHRAGRRSTTWSAPASRRWPPPRATPSRCTPTPSTRRSRCRPTSRPASPATPSCCCSRSRAPPGSSTRGAAATTSSGSPTTWPARAWAHIQEVEAAGGMAKAIEAGHAEAAHRGGRGPHPGPHRLRPPAGDRRQQVPARRRATTSTSSRSTTRRSGAQQLDKLERLRAERDEAACQAALDRADRGGGGGRRRARARTSNLLALAIDAARAKATVGEISDALEKVYGRTPARSVRSPASTGQRLASPIRDRRRSARRQPSSTQAEGRRPRILVAKMGQDGHDRGQKVIATAFADLGFDVDVGPLFQTPAEVARQAVEADVHIVGVNSLAAGHLTLVPALQRRARGARAAATS